MDGETVDEKQLGLARTKENILQQLSDTYTVEEKRE